MTVENLKLGYDKTVETAKQIDNKLLGYGINTTEIAKQTGNFLIEGVTLAQRLAIAG